MNPEKIKSIKGISDVLMEEASEFNEEDYTQLTIRLRDKTHFNRQIFLLFNPVSKANWVYSYFFLNTPEKTKIMHTTYKDNKFLDVSVKETLEGLEQRNPAYYRIYALGEFATLDKLIFPTYEKRLLSKEALADLPSYFGLDFGYENDPSAFIHIKVDKPNKKVYFIEEYVKKKMMNDEISNVIKSLGYHKEVITADSAEKKSIAELRRDGIQRVRPAKKGPDSVIHGIQNLKQYELIVDERCVKLMEELENYTWKKDKKTNEYTNEPVDSYNHVIDATRYAIEGLHNKPTLKLFKEGL